MITTSVAAMLAVAPLAFAQTTVPAPSATPSADSSAGQGDKVSNHVLPGQHRATDLDGASVYDRENANLGDIKDMIIDADGRVVAVVLNVGATLGMGGKFVAVPFRDLKIAGDGGGRPRITISLTKEQLKSAQAFELGERSTTGTSKAPSDRTAPAGRTAPAERTPPANR
jgi:sporulation protein YlmC with PRC-barrel domain